jgi:hypothetical protein
MPGDGWDVDFDTKIESIRFNSNKRQEDDVLTKEAVKAALKMHPDRRVRVIDKIPCIGIDDVSEFIRSKYHSPWTGCYQYDDSKKEAISILENECTEDVTCIYKDDRPNTLAKGWDVFTVQSDDVHEDKMRLTLDRRASVFRSENAYEVDPDNHDEIVDIITTEKPIDIGQGMVSFKWSDKLDKEFYNWRNNKGPAIRPTPAVEEYVDEIMEFSKKRPREMKVMYITRRREHAR